MTNEVEKVVEKCEKAVNFQLKSVSKMQSPFFPLIYTYYPFALK